MTDISSEIMDRCTKAAADVLNCEGHYKTDAAGKLEMCSRAAARAVINAFIFWQPMKTAPKDGNAVLYRHDDGVGRMAWQPDDKGHDWYDLDGDQIAYPESWFPMPTNSPQT